MLLFCCVENVTEHATLRRAASGAEELFVTTAKKSLKKQLPVSKTAGRGD
jgi:hypothetical protein